MSVNIIKLCVGVDSVEHLAKLQRERRAAQKIAGVTPQSFHRTTMMPKRRDEILGGGSIYWVIKGVIQLRQKIIGLEPGHWDDGRYCCMILLQARHHLVRPTPRRAFQGWRYLESEDAPPDVNGGSSGEFAKLPPKMRKELAELGLL